MNGTLVSLLFNGTSILRWNNYPRCEDIYETDNRGYVLHVAIMMSRLIGEKELGVQLDRDFIAKNILLTSFETCILSDINNEVRNRVLMIDNEGLYKKLKARVYEILQDMPVSDAIKKDLAEVYAPQGHETDLELIQFVKYSVALEEATYGSKIYPEIYNPVIASIQKELDQKKFNRFRPYLEELRPYIRYVRGLQFNFRWNRLKRFYPISVMSHSLIVSFICYLISTELNLSQKDRTELMCRGLFHDIPEAVTGDIISPTKQAVEGLEKLISQVETEMVEHYLGKYFSTYSCFADIQRWMLHPFENGSNDNLGKIAKLADYLSALYEAKLETRYNPSYNIIYEKIRAFLETNTDPQLAPVIKKALQGLPFFDEAMENRIGL